MTSTNVYHGSCHCGDVKYQVRLTLPPTMDTDRNAKTVRIYKCNCSTCQKMGFFHCRPISLTEDFIVTSPADIKDVGDYRCFRKVNGWYFCKKCGVRTFGVGGAWEQEELDVEKWAGRESDGKTQTVWKTKPIWYKGPDMKGNQEEREVHYVSVNAVTLETGEGGVDLRKWHEDGYLIYVDCRDFSEPSMTPHAQGMY
ncbi:hypothetical protein EJ04DRAFT_514901 [Polyplosphaeria fusca]|uniref:CENP-V/GFA domain-containing protein n=1 Tax=Polyplosphaeria fusca TaxID=682080 RepID=A0A9P4QQU8_9PLEO|nr:hypothetical protein EJ04DRAFT_514901 [Polyplosphaeria fusca]